MAPGKYPVCNEHSGLTTQVKMVCTEMRENTKAVNRLCVKLEGQTVKSEQVEKDLNNLGKLKADKKETNEKVEYVNEKIDSVKGDVGFLQKILFGGLGIGIVVGIIMAAINYKGGG